MEVTREMLTCPPPDLQSAIERALSDSYDRRFWYQVRTGKCGAEWHGWVCDLPADHKMPIHVAVQDHNGEPIYASWQ